MSHITAFNHPLAAAPSTSNASPLPAAAATPACNQLAALKARRLTELIELVEQVFAGQEDLRQSTLSSIMNSTRSGSVEHQLAEAIYFEQGHALAMQYRIGDMTRLQQEHEAVAAGIATPVALGGMSDFVLRLHLSAWVDSLGMGPMEVDESDPSPASSSSSDEDDSDYDPMDEDRHDSGYETEPTDTEEDSEDSEDGDSFESMDEDTDDESEYESEDDGSKRKYVTVWKKELGKYVTFAY
ncbi:hypothetical protein P171DRAFT_485088 [Karstenula rhodostoma CBS 690.94]|uniref:Uncharacterized protein n=1 Tax=Karstenula rhodostoma CBS 690.94 TaxID=1392251 RepID=A0A9P4PJC0_9PLEO|nr:hypothetical protein P171DRAFT_485088 [Karstenula rhodostoma CBS 690.94]